MSKNTEPVLVPVTVELRDRFGWLKDGVQAKMAAALQKEREGWLKPHISSARAIARSFAKRMKTIRRLQKKGEVEKGAFRRMWAQHNARNIEGVAITPSISLSVNEEGLMKALNPRVRRQVVEMRPSLKLDELFTLAKGDEKLQQLILSHISAAATISITAPKD